MSATLSERDTNLGVESPNMKSDSPSLKGVLATSLDEMLSYQASKKLSMVSSGRATFSYAGSKSPTSSKRSQRSSQRGNHTQRGRSGSPGSIKVDGTTPKKADSMIKAQCPVVENKIAAASDATSVKSESLATSDNDGKTESPSASGQNPMTESPSTPEVLKKNIAVDSIAVAAKSETPSASDKDVKSEKSCASDKAPMVESPTSENVHKDITVDSDAVTVKSQSDSISHIKAKSLSTASQNHEAENPTYEDVNNDIAADPDAGSVKSESPSSQDVEKITSAHDAVTAKHITPSVSDFDVKTESPCASVEALKAQTHNHEDIKKDIPTSSKATSIKSESTAASVDVKAATPMVSNSNESPCASIAAPKADIHIPEDIKNNVPTTTEATSVKSESTIVSVHVKADIPIVPNNIESPCASVGSPKAKTYIPENVEKDIPTSPEVPSVKSGKLPLSVPLKADTPIVSDKDSTIKAKGEHLITKAETPVSDHSEPKPEVQIESKEVPIAIPSVKVRVVSYHRNADIKVRVRNDSQIGYEFYHVRQDTVSGASDALEKKFSTFSSTGDIGNVVHMMDEDDCPVGLNIVFSLLHHKYHELPDRLSLSALYGLARVVEKYQLRHILVPFADKWLVQDLNYGVIMAGDKLENERVMLLTWIFGEGRWFSRTFPKVAKEATLVDGVLMGADGPFAGRYPQELIDIMTRHRQECLQKLKQSIDQPLQDLIKGSRIHCRSKDANAEVKEACCCQQLGSIISGLTTSGMIPFPDPKTYKGSVMNLVHQLEKLRPMRYKVPGVAPHLDTHQMCGIRHLDAINKVAAEPIRLTAQLFYDFKRRGEKTGVFSKELYSEARVFRPTAPAPPLPAFKGDLDHFAHESWVETMQDNWMEEEESNTAH